MTPFLILEAFGQLPSTDLIASEREQERRERDGPPASITRVSILQEAFEARAELMGWSSYSSSSSPARPLPLWNLFEAGMVGDDDDASLIGWVYVGLTNPTDLSKVTPDPVPPGTGAGWATFAIPPGCKEATVGLPLVLPPLVQCLDDALRAVGAVEVSGFQVTCYGTHLQPDGRYRNHLSSVGRWYDCVLQTETSALIAIDRGLLGGRTVAELVSGVNDRNNDPFHFDRALDVPEQHRIRVSDDDVLLRGISFEPSALGMSVRLPEWTASAAGWALAKVVDTGHALAPDAESLAVRITRVP